jgi:hypothetical protein
MPAQGVIAASMFSLFGRRSRLHIGCKRYSGARQVNATSYFLARTRLLARDQLVGIGLRKALEFLMKDFLIEQHPKEADAIKTTLLGGCIEKWVTDPNIKECAKRAAWLGNDETHYTRKWGDRDIEDLKRLVRLTTNWVDNVLLTKRYMAEMPPPSR